jgi:hypothetical protein
MMHSKSLSYREERRIVAVAQEHLRPLHPTRRLGSGARNRYQPSDLLIRHHQLDHLSPSYHGALPRSGNRERGIREQNIGSSYAGFMESVV